MMSGPSIARPWLTTLLMGSAVLLIAAVAVVAVLPLAPCMNCAIRNAYEEQIWREKRYQFSSHGGGMTVDPSVSATPPAPTYCEDCQPRGKMTLLRKWLRGMR